jgi:energy-coupling factor transporter ATP-binding protein EcfA2
MSAVSEADVKENGVEATIENVGAVIQSKIRLVPGALTLLIGDNGVGKTTVQRAITGSIAHSGKGLTPRDGVDAGNVEIGSVKCRIGKRLSYKGDPAETFVLIEGGEDLQELIDPGIERASSADEARIKALIRMSGATIPTEAFVSVVGDSDWKTFTQAIDVSKDNPVDIVAKLIRWLQSKARSAETESQQATGAIAQIGEIPPEPEPIDASSLSTRHSELIVSIATAKERIRAARESRESLEKLSEVAGDPEQIQSQVESLSVAVDSVKDQIRVCTETAQSSIKSLRAELQLEIERLNAVYEQKIADVKVNLANQLEELNASKTKSETLLSEATAKKKSLEEFRATRDRLMKESDTTWTVEAVEALQSEADETQRKIQQAAVDKTAAATRRTKIDALSHQQQKKAEAEKAAKRYRDACDAAPRILADSVKHIPGWSITNQSGDMRLMCEHKRGVICFDQLSPGEAMKRAIDVRCRTYDAASKIPLISIPAELLASMSARARQDMLQHIAEHGISAISSRCSEDGEPLELHYELLQATSPGSSEMAQQQ